MRNFEIAWLYPAEALSPCDGMVHRWDEHLHMMTTDGEEPVPLFQQLRIKGSLCLYYKAAILACLDVELKEIILNHN